MKRFFLIITILVCVSFMEAQTFNERYEVLTDSADYYISRQEWDDAERTTIEALRIDPANPTGFLLWSNLGVIRTAKGDTEGALQAFEIGLVKAPNSTALLSNRAYTLIAAHRDAEALHDLNRVLELDSTLLRPRLTRGMLFFSLGESEKALSDLNLYHSAAPEDNTVLEALGDLSSDYGEVEKAITYYETFLANNSLPEDCENAAFKLAVILIENGNYDKASKLLAGYLKVCSQLGKLYLARAYLHKKRLLNTEADSDISLARRYNVSMDLLHSLFPEK